MTGNVQEETIAGWMERQKIQLPAAVSHTEETGCFTEPLLGRSKGRM